MYKITPGQKVTLQFIHEFYMANGYPPTIQEIASDRDVACNAAQGHVLALVEKGFITKTAGKARSIVITTKGREHIEQV